MTTASITTRVRYFTEDTGTPFSASFSVNGTSTVFDLPVEHVSSVSTLTVVLGGVVISGAATPSYYVDYLHGVLVFYSAPTAGQLLQVQGTFYDYFDDDQVSQAVTDAFALHTNDLDPTPVIDPVVGQCSLPTQEEILVAMLATIELLWFAAGQAAREININTGEVNLPRSARHAQILRQIQFLQDEYQSIARSMGVGVWRIKQFFQRRVSYTTNRFVPIFREQEFNQPYTGFEPTSAPVGATITIYGRYFTGATSVTFGGGVAATSFTVVDDETITAVVPAGAIDGQITITTPSGSVPTTAQFVVGQPAPFVRYGPELLKPPIPPGT